MSLFSKQTWYCNNCGKKQLTETGGGIGRQWIVCSNMCHHQMEYKHALSVLGKECEHPELKETTDLIGNNCDDALITKKCDKCGMYDTHYYNNQ